MAIYISKYFYFYICPFLLIFKYESDLFCCLDHFLFVTFAEERFLEHDGFQIDNWNLRNILKGNNLQKIILFVQSLMNVKYLINISVLADSLGQFCQNKLNFITG